MKKTELFSAAFMLLAVGAYAQGNGIAGITEATNMVTSYFDPGTKLIYAVGAVVGLRNLVLVSYLYLQAWTKRTRVTFACGLVNSATNLLCHFLSPIERFIGTDSYNWRKNRIFALRKELFEKHEEYSVTKQVSNFLSIAHSHASSS